MRSYFFYLLCLFTVISPLQGLTLINSSSLTSQEKDKLIKERSLSESQMEVLIKGEIISQVRVKTKQKTQNLDLWVGGLHPQNCKRALRRISHYEGYPEILNFIKTSQYSDKTQRWKLKIDHLLMPFPMYLDFKMPRVKEEGLYHFTFEKGFLSGLKGEVTARELSGKCFLTLSSKWQGPESKIPDMIFSTFVQTLSELGLKQLIRSSSL